MNNQSISSHPIELSLAQSVLLLVNMEGFLSRLRRYNPLDILVAIAYVVKTGCQWALLPREYPNWRVVYHHFRSLSDRGWFQSFLKTLIEGRRSALGQDPQSSECVIDSQSVRSALLISYPCRAGGSWNALFPGWKVSGD